VAERRWSSYVGYNFGILYFTEEKLFGQGKLAELNRICFLRLKIKHFPLNMATWLTSIFVLQGRALKEEESSKVFRS